jgi:hypothetical protein
LQPRHRPLRFPPRGGALALAGLLALLALDAGLAEAAQAAGLSIGNPRLNWEFTSYLSDGQGGISEEFLLGPFSQIGGELSDKYEAQLVPNGWPDAEVFSNAGATTFWVAADAPDTPPDPIEGDAVGGRANLWILQSFRKDETNASLTYKLTAVKFIGADPSPPNDNGRPDGYLAINVDAQKAGDPGPFFTFADGAEITGQGASWLFQAPSHLSLAPSVGGLNQSYVELSLTAPFTLQIDLSDVDVGEEFTLLYQIQAEAVDTAQVDTGVSVFARDPADPSSGSYFEYTGLTPTDNPIELPEPGGPALLLVGAAVLLGLRGASRRHSSPGRGPRPAALRTFPGGRP